MNIKTFADLIAWQRAHHLAMLVFDLTESFPRREVFGITAQVRRSASSVPANIAEGFGRGTTREFLQFLRVARGSAGETRYFMILSRDRDYLNEAQFHQVNQLCDSTGQLRNALARSLMRRIATSHVKQGARNDAER
ncbi:MAG: four helix bundle protein [Candidatus Acidiferrales bacterium]